MAKATIKKRAYNKKNATAVKSKSVKSAPKHLGFEILSLESDVPLPERARFRDPVFYGKLETELKKMKIGQSMVVPKKKAHGTKNFIKEKYPEFLIKFSTIQPDQNFTRFWRIK